MVIILAVILVPAGWIAVNALYLRSATASSLQISGGRSEVPPIFEEGRITEARFTRREPRVERTQEGNLVEETFDVQGKRVSKTLTTQEGALLTLWDFEPASGKILRYETHDYEGARLTGRRVARWQYDAEGGFVKTNQVFDTRAESSKSYTETVNAAGIKYQEEWFDERNRLMAEKRWNSETGRFESYFSAQYKPDGWAARVYRDEKGVKLREVLVSPGGLVFNEAASKQ